MQIDQLNIACEPKFPAVCALLGEGRADAGQIKEIFDAELVHLRGLVKPAALWGRLEAERVPVPAGDGGAIIYAPAEGESGETVYLAVLLTVGGAGEQYVRELTAQGEHLRALVADAMLSAWIFAMDEKVQREIHTFCVRQGVGVAKRLEAPEVLPLKVQQSICEALHAERLAGVCVTDAYMLTPEKSMCYVLELTGDCGRFAAGHDCGKCEKKDCGMTMMQNRPGQNREDTGPCRMIRILVEDQGKKYDCAAGSILIKTLWEHGVRIDAPCGGSGRCGKCRVRVVGGELPVTAEDRAFLSVRELEAGVRLACVARPMTDLRIRVLAKPGRRIDTAAEVDRQGSAQPAGSRAKEAGAVRTSPHEKSAASAAGSCGIAVDIGTTTLAACLYGSDGKVYETVTAVNSGRDFGADVLSRMEASNNGKRARLQELLQEDVHGLLAELLRKAGVQAEHIQKIVIAANMTMVHLLMGYSCEALGRAPFVPANKRMIRADAMRILGESALQCPVIILPAVSAFVGGDIVAGMLALGMDRGSDTVLLLDVGTNGEMALRHNGHIFVTSAAAGPAFEGGGISCGCASIPGAICSVKLTEDPTDRGVRPADQKEVLTMRTIDGASPVGICGSGVLELVSELLQRKLLDETGLFAAQYREHGFLLGKTASGEPIVFTQGDVRALQLAKGAIRAGIETLLAAAGVSAGEVAQIYLAGGFGVRMDEHAAIRIGLLPEAFGGRIRPVGNSSLSGAVFAGSHAQPGPVCEALLAQCIQVTLADQPEFEENYVKYMNFCNSSGQVGAEPVQ